jgi:hypothetical protein
VRSRREAAALFLELEQTSAGSAGPPGEAQDPISPTPSEETT